MLLHFRVPSRTKFLQVAAWNDDLELKNVTNDASKEHLALNTTNSNS